MTGRILSFTLALAVASTAFGAKLSRSVPKGWDENYEAGKAEAAKSGKLLLLAFSGSDWCGWCVKMEKEIYSNKKFISNAKKNFVLLMIDNPRDAAILSPLAKKQNRELTKKYRVGGFPSTIIAKPDGEEVKRFGGYRKGGVDAFLKELEEVAKSQAPAKKPDEKSPAKK